MRLRNIGLLMVTLAAGACGTSSQDNVEESVDEVKKSDAGHKCHSVAPGDHCGKGGSNHGKSDGGKGHSDADDDDDDDDDDDREDGGKK